MQNHLVGTLKKMPSTACTAQSIEGRYSYSSAVSYAGGKKAALKTDTYIGVATFNAGGQLAGYRQASSDFAPEVFVGNYTVNRDCSVDSSLGFYQLITADGTLPYLSGRADNGWDAGVFLP